MGHQCLRCSATFSLLNPLQHQSGFDQCGYFDVDMMSTSFTEQLHSMCLDLLLLLRSIKRPFQACRPCPPPPCMIQVPDTEDDFVPNTPFIPVHLSDRYPRPSFAVLCCFLFLLCGAVSLLGPSTCGAVDNHCTAAQML